MIDASRAYALYQRCVDESEKLEEELAEIEKEIRKACYNKETCVVIEHMISEYAVGVLINKGYKLFVERLHRKNDDRIKVWDGIRIEWEQEEKSCDNC